MKKIVLGLMVLISFIYAEDVSFTSNSYIQSVVKDSDGKESLELVDATKVIPGDTVYYVNSATNNTQSTLKNITIINQVPLHMIYEAETAECVSSCNILFSVDGGKTFASPQELFVGEGEKRRVARVDEYTTIKWRVDELKGADSTSVSFRAKLQ